MPDLLLEFFSEEIPARMQARAAEDLRKGVTDRLVAAGLTYEGAKAFATPRRLALTVRGVPVRSPDIKDERKGPKVGAPEQAIAGFLRAAGLKSIDEAKVQQDKKGDFYIAVIEKPGRPAIDVIAEIVPQVVVDFPWPKSMRWGSKERHTEVLNLVTESGDTIVTEAGDRVVIDAWLKWVRPLHSIIATFGPETEEPQIVPFTVGGIEAGDTTAGHRFMAPAPIRVKRFDDYVSKLDAAKVVLDPARRAEMIRADAKNLAFAQGFELVEDEGLLEEAAGLVEWPVVLMGSFDAEFLKIPDEVIRATIRNNQKCFVVRDPKTGRLADKFILTANIEAPDGGRAIVAGNERVIRARLSDAKFFYETDLKTKLEDRLPKFEHIVFHEKLGTEAEHIRRIMALSRIIAEVVEPQKQLGATRYGGSMARYFNEVQRAAQLCKADRLTEVVGEFPELQGLMGNYYSVAQGEDESVAITCEEHYKPLGPGDTLPTNFVSAAVALADKLDAVVGFWSIGEVSTGSRDPFGLRRSALGLIRIILSFEIRLSLRALAAASYREHVRTAAKSGTVYSVVELPGVTDFVGINGKAEIESLSFDKPYGVSVLVDDDLPEGHQIHVDAWDDHAIVDFAPPLEVVHGVLSFFADRLKVQLREQGARHDLVDAVFALEGQDDLLLIVRRVEALGKFLDTDDGKNLLAGFKRAANILRIEEKKDGKSYTGAPDAGLLTQAEEKELAKAIGAAKAEASAAVAKEDFAAAMTAMAKLRPHVDAFFDKVTVNTDDKAVRENRLKLLNEIREATRAVADFSRIEG